MESTFTLNNRSDQLETPVPVQWLDRIIIVCLLLFAFCAPISIAATQIAYLSGLLLWLVRLLIKPRAHLLRSCHKRLEFLLLLFFLLTALSSFLSYEPKISINKLRGAALFLIVYFVSQNVRSNRVFRALVAALIAGAMLTVGYTVVDYALGRGIKVYGVSQASPLYTAKCVENARPELSNLILEGVRDGNTVVEANGKKIKSLSDIVTAIERNRSANARPATVKIYRYEIFYNCEVGPEDLLTGNTDAGKLGIADWSRGRDHRAAGFYGHYTTYSEALQLIASLVFGLFIVLANKRTLIGFVLVVILAGLSFSLLLTVTRGSQIGFMVSAFVIVLVGADRKVLLITIAFALPLALAALFVLQQKRNVGLVDSGDNSTAWRLTVWRESLQIYISKPRHLLVGVGMDSIKKRASEWGMFGGGKLPPGHLHSTPLQLAFERGLPALIVWLLILGTYAQMLLQLARSGLADDFVKRGFVLGALGGLAGFFVSGFFHYNLGDSEVTMIFYLIMGISLYIKRESEE